MDYNRPRGWSGGNRRRSFVQPPIDTNNLPDNEYMESVDVMTAEGNEVRFDCLCSGDWSEAFIHAEFAKILGGPIIEFVQSYQTPRGHINCTRAIRALVKPADLDSWTPVQLSILETGFYPHLNIPLIMGRHQVAHFKGPYWPYTQPLQPLVQLDFSIRPSYTFPGAPAMYETRTAGPSGFYNYPPPPLPPAWPSSPYTPPGQAQVVDSPQVGHDTFAPVTTAGELTREDQTRIWVENNSRSGNTPAGYVTPFYRPPLPWEAGVQAAGWPLPAQTSSQPQLSDLGSQPSQPTPQTVVEDVQAAAEEEWPPSLVCRRA
jgi:hypothetical protein